MNLSLLLDIAIGLFFIYLILSLLASEIQEYLATVFQWRAIHLKESIENLLVGDNKDKTEIKRARELANNLYASPLIENINQEAKGVVANLFRQPTWKLGKKYRLINDKKETVFGNGKLTGPSYIPSETFATTLLETLKIPKLYQKFCEAKLCEFKDRLLKNIITILSSLSISEVNKDTLENRSKPLEHLSISIVETFHNFENKLNKICDDFRNNKANLTTSIQRIKLSLDEYILTVKNGMPCDEYVNKLQQQASPLIKEISDNVERELLISEMRPSLTEIAKAFEFERDNLQDRLILEEIKKIDNQTYTEIKNLIKNLPKSVKESLFALAHRAQSKVETVENDINQLRKEIELWFDRSMERASGVYKRNAKGVAILIGFLVAIVANADTFYMVSRLSTDRDLRNAIIQNAELVHASCFNTAPTQEATPATSSTPTDTRTNPIDCVRTQTKAALDEVPLPIGWGTSTLTDQWSLPFELNANQNRIRQWNFFGWNADITIKRLYPQYPGNLKSPKSTIDWLLWSLFHVLLPVIFFGLLIYQGIRIIWRYQKLTNSTYILFALVSFFTACLIIFTGVKVILGVLLGWSLSAVAISMGAPFWFDLLGKVINVRNTGSKPVSSTNKQIVSNEQTASTQSRKFN